VAVILPVLGLNVNLVDATLIDVDVPEVASSNTMYLVALVEVSSLTVMLLGAVPLLAAVIRPCASTVMLA
jgi:hypothetical protein